jgi:Co/Zn/Cd efflux system component
LQGSAVTPGLRRIVRLVALLNLAYFGVEFTVALAIRSVSLFADSIDMNAGAAKEVYAAARAEHRAAVP